MKYRIDIFDKALEDCMLTHTLEDGFSCNYIDRFGGFKCNETVLHTKVYNCKCVTFRTMLAHSITADSDKHISLYELDAEQLKEIRLLALCFTREIAICKNQKKAFRK